MKIKDIFKLLGIDIDKDVEDASIMSSDVYNNKKTTNGGGEDKGSEGSSDDDNGHDDDNDPPTVKEDGKEVEKVSYKFSFDNNTGLFVGVNTIDDPELKEIIKKSNDAIKKRNDNTMIENAINTKLKTLKVIDGVSTDAVIKLLDRTSIKVEDGTVVGVDDAFNNLLNSQGGLFKNDNKGGTEGTPVLEGFQKSMSSGSPFTEESIVNYAYGAD